MACVHLGLLHYVVHEKWSGGVMEWNVTECVVICMYVCIHIICFVISIGINRESVLCFRHHTLYLYLFLFYRKIVTNFLSYPASL